MTVNVSSGWTLFLKIMLPTIWAVFFGSFVVMVIISQPFNQGNSPLTPAMASVLMVSFYLSSLGLMWLKFGRIKRVDMTPDHFYVSSYFNTYRYTYDSIKTLEIRKGFFFPTSIIHFHAPSSFGTKVAFIPSYKLELFFKEYPDTIVFEMTGDK